MRNRIVYHASEEPNLPHIAVKKIPIHSASTSLVLPSIPQDVADRVEKIVWKKVLREGAPTFIVVQGIYEALDVVGDFVKTFTVCQRGCSACCKNAVQITTVESAYISTLYDVKGIAPHSSNDDALGRTPCPFLSEKNGECQIYSARPFNCRTLHTVDDPSYCETPDVPHLIYGSAGLGYGNSIYARLANILSEINSRGGGKKTDIRDFFPEARLVRKKGILGWLRQNLWR